MVSTSTSQKNIWVAASDGDIERVKILIENGQTPNDKDANSYTPMHAAASYAHLELLEYLLSVGGNINITDEEGETPLFTVETLKAAEWLVLNGADVQWKNEEGQTAAEYLEEDHPEISTYLKSLQGPPGALTNAQGPNASTSLASSQTTQSTPSISTNIRTHDAVDSSNDPSSSASALDSYAAEQASALMAETQRIMEEAERTGSDPDEKLREVIERALRDGLAFGGGAGGGGSEGSEMQQIEGIVQQVKRRREE